MSYISVDISHAQLIYIWIWYEWMDGFLRSVTYEFCILYFLVKRPPSLSMQSSMDQLGSFWKEKKAAKCPSLFWYFSSFVIQVIFFAFYDTYSLGPS